METDERVRERINYICVLLWSSSLCLAFKFHVILCLTNHQILVEELVGLYCGFSSYSFSTHLIHSPLTTLITARFTSSSSSFSLKPVTHCISSSGFCGSIHFRQSKRRFRGGVVVPVSAGPGSVKKSEEERRAVLSPQQFRILRRKGTEYPGTGEYDKFLGEGIYNCAGCGTPLQIAICGWPAFYEGLPGAINRNPDPDDTRIEITCAACGGHLGHVFKGEGFSTPTDECHCVNSISLKFVPANSHYSM